MATAIQLPAHPFASPTTLYSRHPSPRYQVLPLANVSPRTQQGSPSEISQAVYTSPQRWAAQQVFQRRTSKSPNIRDGTPIRHTRPEMSRHRSTSRPEALMAYVEEQAQRVQSGPLSTPSLGYNSSPNASLQSYQPQQYLYTTATSPYLNQQPYYDPTSVPMVYNPLPTQRQLIHANQAVYDTGRHGMQTAQPQLSTIQPPNQHYGQQRPPQLPSSSSVPSNFPPISQPLESTPSEAETVGNRPKPQCWDHGCNGRQFSTFSNLLRHQREKSGTATKARCPHCGTEFTRTTARNGHMSGGKCKGIPGSEADDTADADGVS